MCYFELELYDCYCILALTNVCLFTLSSSKVNWLLPTGCLGDRSVCFLGAFQVPTDALGALTIEQCNDVQRLRSMQLLQQKGHTDCVSIWSI